MTRFRITLVFSLIVGCKSSGPVTSEGGSEASSSGTTSSTTTADSDEPANSTSEPTGGGTASTGLTGEISGGGVSDSGSSVCGNGVIEFPEQCDDGNLIPDDACTNTCTAPACGDGILQAGEACDDSNLIAEDSCTLACTVAACGDGLVQNSEQCDQGANNGADAACHADCTQNLCGDGQKGPGEGCDDGNLIGGDGCDANCQLTTCGNSKIDPGEECDDGNAVDTDACTNACTAPVCGDGVVQPGEACDDGVNNGDDKPCHVGCVLDVCGDGKVGPSETCDDGDLAGLDGCSAKCHLEILCGTKLYQCGNGLDDDVDSKFDLQDPECTTPCDDSEKSLQTNLPGQNQDCKSDCYWDANSGSGDDKCEWNLKCDPLNPGANIGCAYDPSVKMCNLMVPQTCINLCGDLVPNGCDCFGCCKIGDKFIYLNSGPDCSLSNPAACQSCTFFPGCNNACEPAKCELCFGQEISDLPPECMNQPTCNLSTPCTDTSECMVGQFCQTGCCADIIPQ